MSRLRVKHTTSFTYEAEVQASYNETRMRPDMSDRQFLLSSQLVITPLSSQHQFTDYWGTRVTSPGRIIVLSTSMNRISRPLKRKRAKP